MVKEGKSLQKWEVPLSHLTGKRGTGKEGRRTSHLEKNRVQLAKGARHGRRERRVSINSKNWRRVTKSLGPKERHSSLREKNKIEMSSRREKREAGGPGSSRLLRGDLPLYFRENGAGSVY